MATVLAIPDLHCPFHHPGALAFVTRLSRQIRPDVVVFLGDEVDAAAWSTHPKNPSMPGPDDEIEAAIDGLRPFFEAFPVVRCCWSNHVARLAKRAAEAGLSAKFLKAWKDVIGAPPGWDYADQHVIDGVAYRHGDGFSGKHAMRNAAERMRCSVVFGHLHSVAGVAYSASPAGIIFGLAAGCLIDPDHEAFAYARYDTARPMLGAGVIYDGKSANFIPLS